MLRNDTCAISVSSHAEGQEKTECWKRGSLNFSDRFSLAPVTTCIYYNTQLVVVVVVSMTLE